MTALTRLNDRTSRQPGRLVGAATAPLSQNARVAVWGVKGGVGTTTVSLLAGLALARHQPGPIVVADESLRVAVQLIGSKRGHAADEHRSIAAGPHGVGKGGDAGIEDLGVGPDLVLVWMATAQHRHP